MQDLFFKKEVEFKRDQMYSVCLRGARRYSTDDEFDLAIYTPKSNTNPVFIADIVSQNQYIFRDLIDADCADNYDESARSISGLREAMDNVYSGFEDREIVTILRFVII